MLVIKILLYILALFLNFKGANAPDANRQKIYFSLSYLTLLIYFVSLFTKINFYTIPLFLLSAFFYLYMGSEDTLINYRINRWINRVRKFCFWATIIFSIVSLLFWFSNLYESDPKTIVTTINLVAVNQGFSVEGEVSGTLYVQGYVSGDATYKYYYQDENGGIHQGSIPVSSTTIYIIDDTQIPHLDINDTYVYMMNGNNDPATIIDQCTQHSVSYKLYIPEGSFAMNNYDVN